MSNIPILFDRKEECCGCSACYAVCPVSAITMIPDEEGFEYPIISEDKCDKCFMCISACPLK